MSSTVSEIIATKSPEIAVLSSPISFGGPAAGSDSLETVV